MKVGIWGSRGSIASAGPETVRYGGNTACVAVTGNDTVLVLDAGTGMRRLGKQLAGRPGSIHVLLTHLHMDHIQGLGFFAPLFQPDREVHVWGPPSTTRDLRTSLTRYLSPPLFPVRIVDVEARVQLHDIRWESWRIGEFDVVAAGVVHPGPTVGYRIGHDGSSIAYLPDHEPALGGLSAGADWTSGAGLAQGVDLLIHDAQYDPREYADRVGWGHSSIEHAARFADLVDASRLMLFHHEPDHADDVIDGMLETARSIRRGGEVVAAGEGDVVDL
jgi:ribonuclease BN (tRNA processing enzyme)